MLELCTRNPNVNCRRLGALQCGPGLYNRDVIIDPGVIKNLRQLKRLSVSLHKVIESLLQRILAADLKIELCQARLLRQSLQFKISRADLCRVLEFVYLVANLAKEVWSPRDINRSRNNRGRPPGIGLRRIR